MTSSFPAAAGAAGAAGAPGALGVAWHAGADLLASYAAGTAGAVADLSVEAHLTTCASCRAVLSAHVAPERLARNRSALLVRAALGDGGRGQRLLRRCGVPDHLLSLLAATPSLRASWLLSVLAVAAVAAAEAAAVSYRWIPGGPVTGHPGPAALAPFLLVAPLLVLAGVAAAFLPVFDPAWRLAAAAPFSGVTLLLVRAVCALAAALVPVTGRAAAAVAGVVRVRARGRDRHGSPRRRRHHSGVVGAAGGVADVGSRSAAGRGAGCPGRVHRRAGRLRRRALPAS
jgi:hypothetical protein